MSSKPDRPRERLPRISMADEGPLDDQQRAVLHKILSGKRGKIVGPLRPLLHSPELADRWQSLGELLRYDTSIPTVLSELVIISTGRYWNSQVEWVIHARIAKEAGVNDVVVEAIRTSQAPVFLNWEQYSVYEFAREFLQHGDVSDAAYRRVSEFLDASALVDLTSIIGYYTMVAMTLNVHDVPIPDDEAETRLPLPSAGELPELSPLPAAQFVGEV